MSNQKVYKKGEVIFKDGDKISNVLFIKSGGVNVCMIKGKKTIDMFQLGANQILGETGIIGHSSFMSSAIATAETTIIELPVESVKQQYEAAPRPMKDIIKSLIERLKTATQEVKSSKMEKDSSPCPEDLVPKIFSSLYFTALHKGLRDEKTGHTEIDWNVMKNYGQRVMGESPKRLEQATAILIKLGLAQFTLGKLPEYPGGPDVILKATYFRLPVLEAFFEFYQYYHFKPGKGDILKYDDFTAQMLEVFVEEGRKLAPDRFGVVSVDFQNIADGIKEKMGITFSNDHFTRLETKGVLCKRRTIDGKVKIEFEIKEFENIYFSWKIIREIDKWNEKGFVDLDEKEERKAKKSGPVCPQCATPVAAEQKFCGECGHKLVPAKAS
ncbi:MAG: cyclic nucleotide-binding domain-containing protein [Bdellovibrionaceae bacterium]|nr:cyclic nucleotide-binding domain-containing protein [Pseudobdellovibrionaceae bacterium]